LCAAAPSLVASLGGAAALRAWMEQFVGEPAGAGHSPDRPAAGRRPDLRVFRLRTEWQPVRTLRRGVRAEEQDMTDAMIVQLALQAMTIAAKMAAPVLLTALVVGFAISLFQSVTQIQEATLSFVPKAAAIGAVLLFAGNWMLHQMMTYTTQLFEHIPDLLR
jgi:flagellar biosynthetic protein FliQ